MKLDTKSMTGAALFAALTAVGALIRIPLPANPIPLTLQVFFVLLAGAILGAKLGALSQIIYLLLGAIGLPVFSGGTSGFGVIFGPTGGYLIGFILAAFTVGHLIAREREASAVKTTLFFLVGILVIYIFGTAQLALVAKISIGQAILGGVLPFLPLDIVKAILAASLLIKLRSHIEIEPDLQQK